MLRRIAAAGPVILMLLLAASAGVAAQDESPSPEVVPAEAALPDVALLEALCEANAPDDAAMANCLDVVHLILAPALSPADDIDLEALGQAYLLAVETYNAKLGDIVPAVQIGSGNERKQYRMLADAIDEWVTALETLAFPPATQVVADRLIEADKEHALLLRELADLKKNDPTYYETQARVTVAGDAVSQASQEMRSLLGLPCIKNPLTSVCIDFEGDD